MRRWWQEISGLVLPAVCGGCGVPRTPLCDKCARELYGRLPRRARPDPEPAGLPPVHAAALYADAVRAVLLAHKERGALGLARPLGIALAAAVRAAVAHGEGEGGWGEGEAPLVLVPVPSSRSAVRARGHDPARRIALAAAAELRRTGTEARVLPVLRRRRGVADQEGLGARERARNLAGGLVVAAGAAGAAQGGRVVLVDDLMTTGASLTEAARALAAAGVVGGRSGPGSGRRVRALRRVGPGPADPGGGPPGAVSPVAGESPAGPGARDPAAPTGPRPVDGRFGRGASVRVPAGDGPHRFVGAGSGAAGARPEPVRSGAVPVAGGVSGFPGAPEAGEQREWSGPGARGDTEPAGGRVGAASDTYSSGGGAVPRGGSAPGSGSVLVPGLGPSGRRRTPQRVPAALWPQPGGAGARRGGDSGSVVRRGRFSVTGGPRSATDSGMGAGRDAWQDPYRSPDCCELPGHAVPTAPPAPTTPPAPDGPSSDSVPASLSPDRPGPPGDSGAAPAATRPARAAVARAGRDGWPYPVVAAVVAGPVGGTGQGRY
jgi:predicted amidophosphoribosyltransferase